MKPTPDPGQSLIQSDSPLSKKLKQALIERTHAFEDMQEKANDYKANLAQMEEEMANWRRKTHEDADEITRLREISDQAKGEKTQLAAELSRAQSDAAAAAANATAVRKKLEQAESLIQSDTPLSKKLKQALIQRTEALE